MWVGVVRGWTACASAATAPVVAGYRGRVARRGTCGDFVGPLPPLLRTALTAGRSDAVPAVPAKPCPLPLQRLPVVSTAALPTGWVGRPVRGVRGGPAVARQPTVLAWRALRVGCRRRVCLCTVLRRARLSACRHHGTCRCVLVATMRAVAGRTWRPYGEGGRWEAVRRRMLWGVGRVRRQWGLAGRWTGGAWLDRCFSGPLWGMLVVFSGHFDGVFCGTWDVPGGGASSRACLGAVPWTFRRRRLGGHAFRAV